MATVRSVYSKALFLTAQQKNSVESIKKELEEFQLAYAENPPLKQALGSSLFDVEARVNLIQELAKKMEFSDLLTNFLILLSRNRRVDSIEEIVSSYKDLINTEKGVEEALLRSAVPLSSEQVNDLSQALSSEIGKKINISQEEDRDLLGGFVVTVAGKTFDVSLRKQLQRMEAICKI